MCKKLDQVVVATDDERIAAGVEAFGGQAIMTRDDHPSGTDRIAEVAEQIPGAVAIAYELSSADAGDQLVAAVVEEADRDPLSYHGRVRARTGGQFTKAIRRTLANASAIKAPCLIMHGSDDRVVSPSGSQLLYEAIGSEDRTLRIFDGGYHELWLDLDKDIVLAAICDWIGCHCAEG